MTNAASRAADIFKIAQLAPMHNPIHRVPRGTMLGMLWRPVLELSASRVSVGVTEEGVWVHEHEGEVVPIEGAPRPFMLTVLERGEALEQDLVAGLVREGLEAALAHRFPTHVGVTMGLIWPSEYWQDLAVRWVDREGTAWTYFRELWLLSMVGRTHKVRHSARRLVRAVMHEGRNGEVELAAAPPQNRQRTSDSLH